MRAAAAVVGQKKEVLTGGTKARNKGGRPGLMKPVSKCGAGNTNEGTENMIKLGLISSIAALAMTATVAHAQDVGPVTVNLANVVGDIAVDLEVSENQIPVTVQVPVSVAANVCGTDVNLLAQQVGGGDATCTAESTSEALNRIVQRQVDRS